MPLFGKKQVDSNLYAEIERREDWAYDYVYKKTYPRFSRWVKQNNGDENDAHDVLTDVLIRFITDLKARKIPFMEAGEILSRIYAYGQRKWKSHLTSSPVKTRATMPEGYELADELDSQSTLEHTETIGEVRSALGKLGDECRELLLLYYGDGLSHKEIGESLGLSEKYAKVKKSLCLKELRGYYFQRKP